MSNLVTFTNDIANLPAPTIRVPTAPELISGNAPTLRRWLQDQSFDGKARAGVWESTPGHIECVKLSTFEYCLIIEGVVEITEDGVGTQIFRKGDIFGLKPGFIGTWRTLETLRKFFVAVTIS